MSVDCGALSIAPCSSFGCRAMFQRWLFVSLWSGLNVFRKPRASCSFCFFTRRCRWGCSLKGFRSHVLAVVLRVSWGLRPRCFSRCFRHVPATVLHVNLCFTGLSGSSLGFQAMLQQCPFELSWISVPPCLPRRVSAQTSFLPWFLTSFCDSGALLPRLCPSCCCPPLQPVSNSATWVDLGICLLWCFPVGFQHDFAHFSDQRISMSGHVSILLRRFLALCLSPRWHQGCV